ncbi:hypothetical protein HRG84_23415 [Flavisolibacter sp. BT320]|nr:hypothetical protein [Flavisolibacter longurius]
MSKRLTSGFLVFLLANGLSVQAQLADVQEKLGAYVKAYTPEKLYLHTDKNAYAAGEILWLKAYAVDGIYHRPFAASKIAYVELLDEANIPASRIKIALDEKGGNGSIQLPFGLKSGNYTLRAYTSWMKNLGASHFFEKGLTIINTLKTPEVTDEKAVPEAGLQLYPEGGDLVAGLPSKVAFRLSGKDGKGTVGKGFLLNEKADTLASFSPLQFGMGQFEFTPQKGSRYKAVFQLGDGNTVSRAMPDALENGYTVRVEDAGSDDITIEVRNGGGNAEVYLLAQTRNLSKAVQKAITQNGIARFTINRKLLGEGVSQFTVFDAAIKPVCERLYFIPPAKNKVQLQTARQLYGTRQKVDLLLDSIPDSRSSLSLAVYQLDEWQSGDDLTIEQYLWLTSELSGPVESPAFYFGPVTEDARRTADLLMMTQGWRRFQWNGLQEAPVLKYPRERAGHLVTGRVTDVQTGSPAKEVQVYLSVPASPYKLFTAISDSNGVVQFEVSDYYGDGEMVVQTAVAKNTQHKVEILTPFAESYGERATYPLAFNPAWQNALLNRSIGMQAQHIYHTDAIRQYKYPPVKDTLPFYGKGMYAYSLDDYVRFNTVEEVLREYVREINVGVKGSGESLRFKLYNDMERRFHEANILVLVDGVPQLNPNKVFDLDPLKIKNLDVIPRNFVLGQINYQGLANFKSYTGQYEGLELDPQAISIDYSGLQLQRSFFTPEYATEQQRESRLPDLRTTLYWQGDVTSKTVSFYTGDNKGRFLAVLQGIDGNGRTISTSVPFEVK